ncbi:hypothetical protein AAF712_006807 [Marasmius tenuissimus]|uniref:Uncharacterized protein n=1 Tax=Marasmius tenuissimus TaxID=585030 RepID=A0ABR2ZWX1_9AGAR
MPACPKYGGSFNATSLAPFFSLQFIVIPSPQLKIIFWFAAQADSTQPRQTELQQEDEEFEALWTPLGEVDQTLTFSEDRQIAQKVIDGARHLINQ